MNVLTYDITYQRQGFVYLRLLRSLH